MKRRKKVNLKKKLAMFGITAAVALAATGSAVALWPEEKKAATSTAPTNSLSQQAPNVASEPEPQQTVQQQEEDPVVVEETTQERIKREVEELAASIGLNDTNKWGRDLVSAQSFCIDKKITESTGYDNDSGWRNLLDTYMDGKQTENGLTRMYYQGHHCAVSYFTVPN